MAKSALSLFTGLFLLLSSQFGFAAPTYPPVPGGDTTTKIFTPNEPILVKKKALPKSLRVLVPTALTEVVILNSKKPTAANSYNLPCASNASLLAARPVTPISNLVAGGYTPNNLIPTAEVPFINNMEVQTLAKVPTRILMGNLKKKSTATVTVINSYGYAKCLGKYNTGNNGTISFPALTLMEAGLKFTIKVDIPGVGMRTFAIRSFGN
jgi:hypothetical protein